ncbi:MAG: CDP-alcohol phosphatidyltransferase family protein [Nanoarchaeota archaeon]|nr:CDP-alcohol phosphatidyltransferase family protein [Nanoarchaeota archaeon]
MFDNFKKKVKEETKVRVFYTEKITRNITPLITKLLLLTPITANQVTFIMLLTGLVAAFLFVFDIQSYAIIGSLLLILQHTLDAVDGEIARYKKISSLRGKYLDIITHYTTEPALFIGIMFGILRSNPTITIIIAGISCAIFISLINLTYLIKKYIVIEQVAKQGKWKTVKKERNKNILSKIYRPLAPIFRWPEYHFVVLLASIFYRLDWLLYFYGCTLPIIFLIRSFVEFYAIPKDIKKIKKIIW